jgi:hypothetical protein
MVARVKDKVTTVAAITARVAKAAAAAMLLAKVTKVKATRDMAASLALPYLYGPPSIILGLVPSTCTSVRLGDRGTTTSPSIAADSHRCVWPDYGRPSVHTTIGLDHRIRAPSPFPFYITWIL